MRLRFYLRRPLAVSMTNSLTMSFLFRKHTGTDNFSQRCSEILRDKKTGKFCSFLLCRRCTVLARSPQVHFQRSCFLDPFSEILRPASFLNVWCAVFSNQDSLSETFRAPRPQGWPPKSVLGSMKTSISRDFQRFLVLQFWHIRFQKVGPAQNL